MGASVIVQRGGEVGRRYVLADRLTVGRDSGNDLLLDDPVTEPYHAVFVRRGGSWSLIDLGGARPVSVDGTALEPGDPHPLRHGDTITIGDGAVLVFHLSALGLDLAAQPTLPLRAAPQPPDPTVRLPTHTPAVPSPPLPPSRADDDPTLRLPTIPPAPREDKPGDDDPTRPIPTRRPSWLGRLWRRGADRPRE